jgi:hypothetical protein
MPILRIIRGPATQGMYDTLSAGIKPDTEHPLGLIMRGASEVGGVIHVAQVWHSERRFDDELAPLLREVGAQPATEDMIFELHHLVTP